MSTIFLCLKKTDSFAFQNFPHRHAPTRPGMHKQIRFRVRVEFLECQCSLKKQCICIAYFSNFVFMLAGSFCAITPWGFSFAEITILSACWA